VNRFVRIAGAVLIAFAMSSAVSGAWAQAGKGNGRGSDRDARPPQQRNGDANRGRDSDWSKEDREQLRRDIRDYGRDVYRDRDRDRGRGDDSRTRRTERDRPRR